MNKREKKKRKEQDAARPTHTEGNGFLKASLTEDEVTLVPSTTAGTKINAQTRTPTFSRTVLKIKNLKNKKADGERYYFQKNHVTHSIPRSVRDLC